MNQNALIKFYTISGEEIHLASNCIMFIGQIGDEQTTIAHGEKRPEAIRRWGVFLFNGHVFLVTKDTAMKIVEARNTMGIIEGDDWKYGSNPPS